MGALAAVLLVLAGALAPARQVELQAVPARPAQGQLVVLTLTGHRPGDSITGSCNGRPLRFFLDEAGRVRALTAIPLKQKPGPVPLLVRVQPSDGEPIIHGRSLQVVAGKFDRQELKVARRFVKPPAAVRRRIRRERRLLRKIWRAPPSPRHWRGRFVWPRRDKICSTFGLRRIFNGHLRSRHYGLDIDGRVGDPVRAIGAGRVVLAADLYTSGGTIIIDHGLRLFSLYFHLSSFAVARGDKVERGQLIGKVGESGRVTGPHLHLSTKIEGVSFDPLSLLQADLDEEGPSP